MNGAKTNKQMKNKCTTTPYFEEKQQQKNVLLLFNKCLKKYTKTK